MNSLYEEKKLLDSLHASIIDSNKYLTQQDAIKYITSYVMYTPINMDKETGARKTQCQGPPAPMAGRRRTP